MTQQERLILAYQHGARLAMEKVASDAGTAALGVGAAGTGLGAAYGLKRSLGAGAAGADLYGFRGHMGTRQGAHIPGSKSGLRLPQFQDAAQKDKFMRRYMQEAQNTGKWSTNARGGGAQVTKATGPIMTSRAYRQMAPGFNNPKAKTFLSTMTAPPQGGDQAMWDQWQKSRASVANKNRMAHQARAEQMWKAYQKGGPQGAIGNTASRLGGTLKRIGGYGLGGAALGLGGYATGKGMGWW